MTTIKFKIDPANEWAQPPAIASDFTPSWYKDMPQRVDTPAGSFPVGTAKICSPFQDAMFGGYVIPLPWVVDVNCDADGQLNISWMPANPGTTFTPISMHDREQLPCKDLDGHIFKFHVPWVIEVPEGYCALYTHPLNRPDLPFQTFSGIVDNGYKSPVNIPFMWVAGEGRTILDGGTPIAQVIPFKVEEWHSMVETVPQAELVHNGNQALMNVRGYRRHFRIPKVWR